MYNIYVVEDDLDISLIIKSYLEKENYNVKTFSTGEEAICYINDNVHLWILDIMLAGKLNGYDVIKNIKDTNSTPVIFLSARDHEVDRIIGLESGSDDYITKPFSPRELILRVNKLLSRVYSDKHDNSTIKYQSYRINTKKRTVEEDNNSIHLTNKEFELLIMLLKNLNYAFSRDSILDTVWGEDYFGSDRTVDDLVRRLRKKMPSLNLETVYGYGYRLT